MATIATTAQQRRKGLLGVVPDELSPEPWVLVIPKCRSVHTIGMQFPIDVAYLGRDGDIVDLTTMHTGRVGRPRLSARSVIETGSGQCAAWGLAVGDRLSVSG